MKNKKLILLITLTWLTLIIEAQLPENFPIISEGEIEGTEIIRSRTFSGSALYGYMNGGAELYHEYGFSDAVITELSTGTGKYKVEVFRMKNPESAFGIFSVSSYKCLDSPPDWKYSCRAKYQLQVCRGSYYISVINSNGNKADSLVSMKIARLLTEKIKDNDFDITAYTRGYSDDLSKESIILVKGRLGIVNGSPDLEDYFRGAENFTLVVLKRPDRKVLSVRFSDPESLSKFTGMHNWNNLQITSDGIKAPSGEIIKRFPMNHLVIEITL